MLEGEPEIADRIDAEGYLPMVYNARTLFTDLPPHEDVEAQPLTYDDLAVKKWLWKHWRLWPRDRSEAHETDVQLVQERQSVPLELLEAEIDEILDQELWAESAVQNAALPALTEEEIEREIEREALRPEGEYTIYHQHNL